MKPGSVSFFFHATERVVTHDGIPRVVIIRIGFKKLRVIGRSFQRTNIFPEVTEMATGSYYYAMALQIKARKRKFKWENKTIGQFMTASITPFQLILEPRLWFSLPFPLMIVPTQTKEPGTPLIRFQLPFLLPLEGSYFSACNAIDNHNIIWKYDI